MPTSEIRFGIRVRLKLRRSSKYQKHNRRRRHDQAGDTRSKKEQEELDESGGDNCGLAFRGLHVEIFCAILACAHCEALTEEEVTQTVRDTHYCLFGLTCIPRVRFVKL